MNTSPKPVVLQVQVDAYVIITDNVSHASPPAPHVSPPRKRGSYHSIKLPFSSLSQSHFILAHTQMIPIRIEVSPHAPTEKVELLQQYFPDIPLVHYRHPKPLLLIPMWGVAMALCYYLFALPLKSPPSDQNPRRFQQILDNWVSGTIPHRHHVPNE